MTDDEFYVDGLRFYGLKSMLTENQAIFDTLDERFGSFAEFLEFLNLSKEKKATFKQMAQFTYDVAELSPSFPEIGRQLSVSDFASSSDIFDTEVQGEYSEYAVFSLQSAEEFVAPSGCSSLKAAANLTIPGVVASALSCGKAAAVGAAEAVVSIAGTAVAEGAIAEVELASGGTATPVIVPAAEAVAAAEGSVLAGIWGQVTSLCGAAVGALALSGAAGIAHDSSCQARRDVPGKAPENEIQKINNCIANAKKNGSRTESCYPQN